MAAESKSRVVSIRFQDQVVHASNSLTSWIGKQSSSISAEPVPQGFRLRTGKRSTIIPWANIAYACYEDEAEGKD